MHLDDQIVYPIVVGVEHIQHGQYVHHDGDHLRVRSDLRRVREEEREVV